MTGPNEQRVLERFNAYRRVACVHQRGVDPVICLECTVGFINVLDKEMVEMAQALDRAEDAVKHLGGATAALLKRAETAEAALDRVTALQDHPEEFVKYLHRYVHGSLDSFGGPMVTIDTKEFATVLAELLTRTLEGK